MQRPSNAPPLRSHAPWHSVWRVAVALALVASGLGCELAIDVDRSRIGADAASRPDAARDAGADAETDAAADAETDAAADAVTDAADQDGASDAAGDVGPDAEGAADADTDAAEPDAS